MDGLIGIALFFLFYPIVVSIISSKLNKARYREVNEIVAALRKTVAELQARVAQLGVSPPPAASSFAQSSAAPAPAPAQPRQADQAPVKPAPPAPLIRAYVPSVHGSQMDKVELRAKQLK
jgi:electron transfer flavoprotein alpha/beta subunit